MAKATQTKKTEKRKPAKKGTKKRKVPLGKKVIPEKIPEKKVLKYWEGIGRRKTAIARVRIFEEGEKRILINDQDYESYFHLSDISQQAILPLKKLDLLNKFGVLIKVAGGGITSQAEAIRHGLSRALLKYNQEYRAKLRRFGYLTRDPRMKERKKFGLKRARRAPQWQKR